MKQKINKRKIKKILIRSVAVIAVLVFAAVAFAGNYLVTFAIERREELHDVAPDSVVSQEDVSIIINNYKKLDTKFEEWYADVSRQSAEITSDDGLTLKGDVFMAEENSHKWLIVIHGYTGKRSDMYHIANAYAEKGYNVLAPDMRAHGESEGDYIGMGWLDRKDVLKWIDYVISLDSEAEIILHGVSMGGATVMMTAGEELSDNVKGVVEDCGYTSVWDIFSDELEYIFGLPEFPLLHAANVISKVRAGYNFIEASAVEQVAKAKVPMLFIHGAEDNFVHTDMVYEVYAACTTEKDILVVEGAGHGQAYGMDPELYFGTVFNFIEEKCGD